MFRCQNQSDSHQVLSGRTIVARKRFGFFDSLEILLRINMPENARSTDARPLVGIQQRSGHRLSSEFSDNFTAAASSQ